MYYIITIAASLLLAYFFVDWKNWLNYYPTIQFYIICNMLYNFIFYNHTLWAFNPSTPWLNHTLMDITFSFIIIPTLLMIYLRYTPKELKWKFAYIIAWVSLFTIVEFLFNKKGLFIHANGWEIHNSGIFNAIMFTILGIHLKKPLIAILLSIPIVLLLLYFHHPSFGDLK
ncbi:CBO0543 family protein [Mesobacillus subterraneus]|uniref:Uncharacterized protein n=1 Tax=Mesobacillus subterraneus TaxID=285983 RepID=A0A3R9FUN5_9BACI|nr:CBO0543 family protein [Mesobacillus subterraneus]RSD25487.1 hypothetical protein EJA10_16920 [Mesobacillus subterraneus]